MTQEIGELWAWVTQDPEKGLSQVGVYMPEMGGHVTLTFLNRETATKMAPVAREHGRGMGQKTWLRRFRMVEDYPPIYDPKA